MRKFKFSLQTVLDVRELKEEKAKKAFSAVLAQRVSCLNRVSRLEGDQREIRVLRTEKRKETVQVGALERWFQNLHDDLGKNIRSELARLAMIDRQLEAKRIELVQASKDRKVLDKLKENQFKNYLLESSREEQAFLDDMAQHSQLRHSAAQGYQTA